jgi:hypothetical protein
MTVQKKPEAQFFSDAFEFMLYDIVEYRRMETGGITLRIEPLERRRQIEEERPNVYVYRKPEVQYLSEQLEEIGYDILAYRREEGGIISLCIEALDRGRAVIPEGPLLDGPACGR